MSRYLMRFDDINPEMDWERFFLVKNIGTIQYKVDTRSCPKL